MEDSLQSAVEAEDRGLEKTVLVTGLRKTGKCSVDAVKTTLHIV